MIVKLFYSTYQIHHLSDKLATEAGDQLVDKSQKSNFWCLISQGIGPNSSIFNNFSGTLACISNKLRAPTSDRSFIANERRDDA